MDCEGCEFLYARPGNVGDEEPPEPYCHAHRCPDLEPDEEALAEDLDFRRWEDL